jgi:hypothetical protein
MQALSLIKRHSTLVALAVIAGMGQAGLGLGAQRDIVAQSGRRMGKSAHERHTGPKHTPRKTSQERLAAAEAKRQRRQARNLSWGRAGGIAFV